MPTQTLLLPPVGLDTAPEGSKPILQRIEKSFTFIPNLFGVFANSPTLLEGYMGLSATYGKGSLTPAERELVLLTASVENACGYCTAAHSTLLKGPLHASAETVAAVRSKQPLPDSKLNALAALTREIVAERGHAKPQTVDNFLAAGFAKEQVLEVVVGVALKTMSNYTHAISSVEVDAAFAAEK